MLELQDLSDEVLAINVSSLEAEKEGNERASRISLVEKAMEGPGQTYGAATEEERPILLIEAAPSSLNEVPARGEPAPPPPPTSNSKHDESQGAPEGVVPLFTYPGFLAESWNMPSPFLLVVETPQRFIERLREQAEWAVSPPPEVNEIL
nr:hypothetical protein Iba_chr07eCG5620 [Ipomoea batatas]